MNRLTRVPLLTLAIIAIAGATTPAVAKPHAASATCRTHVSDLSIDGRPLTFERLQRSKKAYLASSGTVYAEVRLPNGRHGVYTVSSDGCAHLTSRRLSR